MQKQLRSWVPSKRQRVKGEMGLGVGCWREGHQAFHNKEVIIPYLHLSAKPREGRTGSRSHKEMLASQLRALLQEMVPGLWATVGIRDLHLSPVCPPHPPCSQVLAPLSFLLRSWNKGKRQFYFLLYSSLFSPKLFTWGSAAIVVNGTCCFWCFLKNVSRTACLDFAKSWCYKILQFFFFFGQMFLEGKYPGR